jgi:putative cell wall-binding protein
VTRRTVDTGQIRYLLRPMALAPSTQVRTSRRAPARALWAGFIAVLLACVGVLTSAPAQAAAPVVDRLSGSDRYATLAMVSAKSFAPGVSVAYVASGASFPDALAGAAVAGRDHAPLLLVGPTGIPSAIATELGRLAPKRIVVLGGTGSVSGAVQSALAGYTTGSVTRLAGSDRYATAAQVSKTSFTPNVTNVFVATGQDFPDALSGSAAAGAKGVPLLLVKTTSLPAATAAELKRLNPSKITVLGGVGAVNGAVFGALGAIAPVTRIAGADRYSTSVLVSKTVFTTATRALMATGTDFADALSGAPVAAGVPGPVLLSKPTCVPKGTRDELTRLGVGRVTLLGGTGALSAAVASLTVCPSVVGQVCTNPYFTTSNSNGGVTDGAYYVHNNLWNASGYPGTKGTTQVCSYHSWNHIGTASNSSGDGAVKTYPNVHKDYDPGRKISSFTTLKSSFAATAPGVGIYNVGYDLWLNGVPNEEVMIWTDNRKQVPAGSRVASGVSLSGYRWDVYTSGSDYIGVRAGERRPDHLRDARPQGDAQLPRLQGPALVQRHGRPDLLRRRDRRHRWQARDLEVHELLHHRPLTVGHGSFGTSVGPVGLEPTTYGLKVRSSAS